MATSLKDNAYHILGLDGSASGRKILQRANEIVQRIKIDDRPDYDLDIPAYEGFRTEETVRDALRRLQAPKPRIKEHFFWFRVGDQVDSQAVGLLAQQDYHRAIAVWENATRTEGPGQFQYMRNLALAYCVALLKGTGQGELQKSLVTWKSIIESEPFWASFLETCKQDSDNTISKEALTEFRTAVSSYLSDIYAELQVARGSTEYVFQFRQFFAAKGERIEKEILNPTYQSIVSAVEAVESIEVGEGEPFDQETASRLKSAVGLIQTELNKLIEAGLFDDSGTKMLRDRAANALRSVSIDLHNHHNQFETSLKLLEISVRIAGTDSLKAMLSADVAQIQKNISDDQDNTLTIEVPGTFGGGTVVFKNDYLTYGNRKILYKDASSISYHSISRSVNFIPISQSYSYMVSSENETISFSFGTTLYIGNKEKRDVWAKLAGFSQHLIEPHIVEKLVRRIFRGNGAVNIGGIVFERAGYSRSKMFGGRDSVLWTDTVYIPNFSQGSVFLFKDKNGTGASFASVPMSEPNAVVIPDLVKACVNLVQTHAAR